MKPVCEASEKLNDQEVNPAASATGDLVSFTPGPWVAGLNCVNAWEVSIGKNGCRGGEYLDITLATEDEDCTRGPRTMANAYLIAAAPEMHGALNDAVRILKAIMADPEVAGVSKRHCDMDDIKDLEFVIEKSLVGSVAIEQEH